jgi:hypothetical protein
MSVNSASRLSGPSALQAYRSDLPRGGAEPTVQDADAILVATLLRQSLVAETELAERLRREGLELARRSLGSAALAMGCTYDDNAAESGIDVLRLLAQRTAQAGRLSLSQHLLESATELTSNPSDLGRILSERARNSRKQGRLDLAEEQTLELMRRGKRAKSPLLMALAHDGFAALAQMRGNFVLFGVQLGHLARLAEQAGLTKILASAHSGLGIRAGMAGNHAEAVSHFWSAYHIAGGAGVTATAALSNLGQSLLGSGRPAEARKISSLVLQSRPPVQTALAALGSYAVSSARMTDAEGVEWACSQVRQLSKSPHFVREVAGALVECSAALAEIGRAAQAAVLRRRAEAIAIEYGFNDLTFSEAIAASSGLAPERQEFVGAAARAADEIANLDVTRLPKGFEPVFA